MDDNVMTSSSRPTGPPAAVLPDLAERLVEEARADGVELIGPGGLLGDLTKRVLEAGLEAELSDHLGYERHAVEGRDGGNSRNGHRPKTVITDIGPVPLKVPRDRFQPKLVRKRQRRLAGVDELIISLTATGSPPVR
jgi:transposase-like protein